MRTFPGGKHRTAGGGWRALTWVLISESIVEFSFYEEETY